MKILIVLSLIITLSSCLSNKHAVKNKTANKIDAVVSEQASFEWKEKEDPFLKLPIMPENNRKKVVTALKKNKVGFTLYFDYDSTKINEKSLQEIAKHIEFMKKNPTIRLRLEGHTDTRGTRDYNLALGENRAIEVKKIMALHKNIGNRIEVISYGEEKPNILGNNPASWKKNRRVKFIYK